jgi:hypothetical protein
MREAMSKKPFERGRLVRLDTNPRTRLPQTSKEDHRSTVIGRRAIQQMILTNDTSPIKALPP